MTDKAKAILTTLLLISVLMTGCNSRYDKANDLQDSVYRYEDMAKYQTDLQTDANISKDYTEAVIHEALSDTYKSKAHRFKDSLFNLEYKTK